MCISYCGWVCNSWNSRGYKYFFWSIFVPIRQEARRGPKNLPFILSNQKELRTRAQKWKCFQVLKMASPARRNLQAIRLLPDMLWQYQREFWRLEILKFMRHSWIMVKDRLLKLYWLHIQIVSSSLISLGRNTELQNDFVFTAFQGRNITLFKAR